MEDVFNKLNSKFIAYNWNKNSPLSNNETTEEIKNQIMAILKGCQLEPLVKPANDVIKIIDEMIATSKQIEIAELDADEDCDNENLIAHQGRIYALTQLKNRLSV